MDPQHEKTKPMISPKELVFAGVVVLFAGLVGWSFRYATVWNSENFVTVGIFLGAALFFAVFLSLFAMSHRLAVLTVAVPILSGLMLFISHPFHTSYLWGIVGSSLLFIWGVRAMRREANERTRYRWNTIARYGIKKFFTAISLAFAILSFALSAPSDAVHEVLFPRPLFDGVLIVMERPLGALFPAVSLTSTVDKMLVSILLTQGGGLIGADISSLPKALLQPLITKERQALNWQYGLHLTGKEKLSSVLYTVVAGIIDSYVAPYDTYVPAAVAVGYFITLQFVFFLLGFVLYLLFPATAWLLLAVGILTKERIMVDKEILSL